MTIFTFSIHTELIWTESRSVCVVFIEEMRREVETSGNIRKRYTNLSLMWSLQFFKSVYSLTKFTYKTRTSNADFEWVENHNLRILNYTALVLGLTKSPLVWSYKGKCETEIMPRTTSEIMHVRVQIKTVYIEFLFNLVIGNYLNKLTKFWFIYYTFNIARLHVCILFFFRIELLHSADIFAEHLVHIRMVLYVYLTVILTVHTYIHLHSFQTWSCKEHINDE